MASDEQFSLCWNNFHANMSAGFHGLLSRGDLVDVTLAAEGRLLQAHKLVLSVCSPYFQEMFKLNPTQHPIVFLKDVSHSALRDLLQFMYQGEVNVKQEELASFISTAEQLQVKGLTGNQNEESSTPSKPKPTSRPGPRSSQQRQSVMTKLETDLDSKPSSTPVAIKRPNRPSIASNNSSSSQSGPVKRKCVDPLEAGPSGSAKEEFVTIPDEDENNAVAPKMEPEFVNESMWDDDDDGTNNDETNFGEDDSNMEMTGFDGSTTGDGNLTGGAEGGAVGDAQDQTANSASLQQEPLAAATSHHAQQGQRATNTLIEASSSQYIEQDGHVLIPSIDPILPGYVLQTLKCTNDGKAILNQGQKAGILDHTQRNLLVKLVISPLFESDPNIVIPNKLLQDWALEIQEIFPQESAALYFTPYVPKSVRNTARNASGKLLCYVYNRRRQLKEKGIIEGTTRSRSSTVSRVQSPLYNLKDTDLHVIEDKLTVLKNTLEPWNVVEECWIATANYRLKKKYSELGGTLEDIFNEYPALKQPAGYKLLLKDFEILHDDKSDALYINIKTLQNKVFELARKKLLTIRDKELKLIVEQYLSAVTVHASDDTLSNACLLLLPFLSSSMPFKDRKKAIWEPSKTEVRDGIITQIASDAELETTITNRKAKLARFGKTLQPFVIFVGSSISEVSHCYVVAGNIYYKFSQLLTAVDVCYKIIHATGVKYQEESFIIWMIIQKAFYRMQTDNDKEFTKVNSLLVNLGVK